MFAQPLTEFHHFLFVRFSLRNIGNIDMRRWFWTVWKSYEIRNQYGFTLTLVNLIDLQYLLGWYHSFGVRQRCTKMSTKNAITTLTMETMVIVKILFSLKFPLLTFGVFLTPCWFRPSSRKVVAVMFGVGIFDAGVFDVGEFIKSSVTLVKGGIAEKCNIIISLERLLALVLVKNTIRKICIDWLVSVGLNKRLSLWFSVRFCLLGNGNI